MKCDTPHFYLYTHSHTMHWYEVWSGVGGSDEGSPRKPMYLHPYMGVGWGGVCVWGGEWDDSHVRDREERRPTDTERETEPVGSGRAGGVGGGCSHAQSPRTCPTGHQQSIRAQLFQLCVLLKWLFSVACVLWKVALKLVWSLVLRVALIDAHDMGLI